MPPLPATTLFFVAAAVAAFLIQHSSGTHLNLARWKRQSPCRRNQYQCNSGACLDVYLLCDGKIHCSDESDETGAICHRKVCPSQAFKCDYGACIDRAGLCNGVEDCADGSDEKHCAARPPGPPGLPGLPGPPGPQTRPPGPSIPEGAYIFEATEATNSQVQCPALAIPSRDISCKLNNRQVNCSQPVPPGTKGSVQCGPFYSHTEEEEEAFYDVVCQFDGTWSRNVTRCQPTCGVSNPDGVPFIAGGTKAKYGEFPWHVGIYRPNGGTYEQICGGSIISERVIVSAGHCFWNDATSSLADMRDYKVAIGKYYREWNSRQDMYVQSPEIEKIVLHKRFRGNLRNWHNDIAVITLKTDIRMTLAARPICVDFKSKHERQFAPGLKGTVVGWGVTETMKPGEVLYSTTLPYVSFEDCEKEVPKPFLVFLSNDKFCAGYQNGTSVCPGDGGGGFATRFSDGKWYLTGIVSVGVPARNGNACNVNQYATFTTLSDYYNFIEENTSK